MIVEKYYGKLTLDFQHRPQEEAVVSPPRKALNDHHPKFMVPSGVAFRVGAQVDLKTLIGLGGFLLVSHRMRCWAASWVPVPIAVRPSPATTRTTGSRVGGGRQQRTDEQRDPVGFDDGGRRVTDGGR